jgi:hypothetical protein
MPKLGLNRLQLAGFLKNPEAIRAFEQLFDFQSSTPTTIEEAASLAGTAAVIAQQALDMLAVCAQAVDALSAAPARADLSSNDDFTPAQQPAGTLAQQDASAVKITGGNVDGTEIGATAAAKGTFSDLAAQAKFGCNGAAPQSAAALGAAATDLASVINLTNNIRSALIADGIGS